MSSKPFHAALMLCLIAGGEHHAPLSGKAKRPISGEDLVSLQLSDLQLLPPSGSKRLKQLTLFRKSSQVLIAIIFWLVKYKV